MNEYTVQVSNKHLGLNEIVTVKAGEVADALDKAMDLYPCASKGQVLTVNGTPLILPFTPWSDTLTPGAFRVF